MSKHHYHIQTKWTGNRGEGTSSYREYNRSYTVQSDGKPLLEGTADPAFLGDPGKYNPEEMFLASLSACHMLWYLHLCADHNITVTSYTDRAEGVMTVGKDGRGKFQSVTLKPVAAILENEKNALAKELHREANRMCFIANSCNFTIEHQPVVENAALQD